MGTVDTMDSYGDGWNGAELCLYQGLVLDTLTLSDGNSGWGKLLY